MPRALLPLGPQDFTGLAGWDLSSDGTSIHRAIEFKTFNEAFAFMARVAMRAEQVDHHPDWRNVWRRVEIRLTTHDTGGLTQLDLDMAHFIDSIAPAPEA